MGKITIREAAVRFGISKAALNIAANEGKIKFEVDPSDKRETRMVDPDDIREFMTQRAKPGPVRLTDQEVVNKLDLLVDQVSVLANDMALIKGLLHELAEGSGKPKQAGQPTANQVDLKVESVVENNPIEDVDLESEQIADHDIDCVVEHGVEQQVEQENEQQIDKEVGSPPAHQRKSRNFGYCGKRRVGDDNEQEQRALQIAMNQRGEKAYEAILADLQRQGFDVDMESLRGGMTKFKRRKHDQKNREEKQREEQARRAGLSGGDE